MDGDTQKLIKKWTGRECVAEIMGVLGLNEYDMHDWVEQWNGCITIALRASLRIRAGVFRDH